MEKVYAKLVGELKALEAPAPSEVLTIAQNERLLLSPEARASRMADLRADIEAFERVLPHFDSKWRPDETAPVRPYTRRIDLPVGAWTRTMVQVLREAGRPLSVAEIVAACCARLEIALGDRLQHAEHKNRTNRVLTNNTYGLFEKSRAGNKVFYSLRDLG